MDVGKLIRKLEPVIPEKTAHWRRVIDLGDADIRSLLEKEIVRTAYELLGDFRKKPLLSLPPEWKSKRAINLGTVIYEAEKWPFGISDAELLRNMGIFGMSGSGKTNVAFHILLQLARRRVPFLFWDWKRTARHLLPILTGHVNVFTPGRKLSPLPFNPFIVPLGLEASVYVNHIVDILADAYTLGDGAKSLLQKAIAGRYRAGDQSPTVEAIRAELERTPATNRARGWKISAVRALESLEFAGLVGTDQKEQETFAGRLLAENSIIELDALDQGSKKFLIPAMCLWLYYVQLASQTREQLRLVIFVEEAHHVLYRQEQRARETMMSVLLRQCREIGIGVIVIDQHPHLISSAAIGNTYTTLCLNQRDPTDINKAARLSLVDDGDKRWFSMLPVGRAIVKLQDRWRRPFVVQVPLVRVRKGGVSDDLLRRLQGGSLTRAGLRTAVERAHGSVAPEIPGAAALDSRDLDFVKDVLEFQDDGVRLRYRRLGLSVDKGNRIKRGLVDRGVLTERPIAIGRTRKLLLRVTPGARTQLGLTKVLGRGSVEHEYWKRFYADLLRRQGFQVELEAPRARGRVDVLARQGAVSVAAEIESGKSDAVSNVRNDLLSGIRRVLVVATDERAFARVEGQLARAGLLVPRRVQLVLRDEHGGLNLSSVRDGAY